MAASRASWVGVLGALALVAGCDASSWGVPVPMVDTGTRFDAGVRDSGALDGSMDASDGSRDAARDGAPTDTSPDVGNDASGRGLLCAACTTDDDCSANSFCVQLATTGQLACLVRCDAEIPSCPRRFDCLNSVITPTPGPVCTPVGAPCCIDNDDDGYGAGIGCRGTDCNDDNASVSPMATEVCDGVDNDCDGMIDQGDPGSGQVCSTGMPGVCGPGVSHCVSGAIACQPTTPAGDETCNGLDDDCDANLDEGPSGGALTQPCYGGPTGTEGVGICAAGLQTCSGGAFGTCTGEVRPGTESCNGMDDDCDGTPDDGNPGGGVVCSTGQPGACSAGTTHCNLGAIECQPNLMSMGESCNGLDDNCNGMVDEGSTGGALTQPCYGGPVGTEGVGLCMAGSQTCSAGSFGACTSEVRPVPELCNDRDDDCDGTVDDGNPGGGFACTTGAAGVCSAGTAQCQSGAIACVPTITAGSMPELCDGLDNDCDGNVDDGFAGLAGPCSAGTGACTRIGVLVCNAADRSGPPICNATPGTPGTEICDGLDNDCNGTTDEGFANLAGPCSAGVGACTRPGVFVCNPANRTGAPICNATPGTPGTEICDGLDNDCDGNVDDGFAGLAGPCAAGVGACTQSGVLVCNPANRSGPPICNATPGTPGTEICDGIDNDCDGNVDDGFAGLSGPCSAGVGACAAIGVLVCNPANRSGAPICNATPGTPGTEICDGIDNNCNGTTDEGFANLAGPCSAGVGACTASGVFVCNPANRSGAPICSATPGSPTTEICDGIDNNCNGTVDEGFAGLAGPCSAGVGECAASGVLVCNPANRSGPPICNAMPGGATTEICDGLDNDCDGTVDDGFAGLAGPCSAGVGACAATGVLVCNPANRSGPPICNATPGSPVAELCDGIDNNCNGTIDDGFAGLSGPCSAGVGACSAIGVLVCNPANRSGPPICNATPGSPSAERCDGIDNNCNGSTDETFAGLGTACTNGLGVCLRGGVTVCAASQLTTTCTAPVVTGTGEICNYLDDDCDGTVDDGFVNGSGLYTQNTNCGACGVDCTMIFAHPNAFGTCNVSGSSASCVMNCNANSFDLNAVPNDGCEFTLDASAIYVSTNDPMSADDATCGLGPVGTGAGRHPCRTIAFGQSRATATSRTRVLIADGLYNVDVTLVNGQSLLGGYRADTWERHVATTLTTIRGTTGAGHRRTITATNITSATLVEGFSIEAASASSPGANSYAIYVSGGTSALSIQNNVVYAGNGAPGGPGSAGADGAAGTNGSPGLVAIGTGSTNCSTTRLGGAGGAQTCGGVSVSGGAGGNAVCRPLNDGTPHSSSAGGTGSGTGGGAGGARAYDLSWANAACTLCNIPTGGQSYNGSNGAFGANGSNGAAGVGAASATGSVIASEWVGTSGGGGGTAGNGGGGGGGSAGGGGQANATCVDDLGGTGGGGGSGGCGGALGTGGLAGGGSFAIFVVNTASYPVIANNIIYRGFGGTGGNGGRGGAGGVAGNGAAGGAACTGACFCSGAAGTGGGGGNGGQGGGGGGGAGGVSYGIYVSGASGYGAGTNTFPVSGGGGSGGSGGPSLGNAGTNGVTGTSAATD
ncbi:MAG: putative metal-binding motif-containing protein [Sandaracinus sp.]